MLLILFVFSYSEEISKSLSDTIKVGAFVVNKQVVVNEDDLVIPDVPFSSLLTPRQNSSPSGIPPEIMNSVTLGHANVAATTSAPVMGTTISNIIATTSDSNNGNNENNITSKCNSRNGSRRSSCSITSANDDFIMVDLVIILSLHQDCHCYLFYIYYNWHYLMIRGKQNQFHLLICVFFFFYTTI